MSTQSLQQTYKPTCAIYIYIYTYIVSRHLATRGNNKIMCTSPPHISTSEYILPHLSRRTLAQLKTNKSPFLKSYLHTDNTKSHLALLYLSVKPTRTTHIISSTAPTYAAPCRPWPCGQTSLQ